MKKQTLGRWSAVLSRLFRVNYFIMLDVTGESVTRQFIRPTKAEARRRVYLI
jgi:hypothetical protein